MTYTTISKSCIFPVVISGAGHKRPWEGRMTKWAFPLVLGIDDAKKSCTSVVQSQCRKHHYEIDIGCTKKKMSLLQSDWLEKWHFLVHPVDFQDYNNCFLFWKIHCKENMVMLTNIYSPYDEQTYTEVDTIKDCSTCWWRWKEKKKEKLFFFGSNTHFKEFGTNSGTAAGLSGKFSI